MGENSTITIFSETSKATAMKVSDATENLDADDLIFYNSLRPDLDLLKKNPSPQILHNILNYSKSLR